MNKIFKGLIRFLIEVIVMTVLVVGINIFTNGITDKQRKSMTSVVFDHI